MDESKAHFLNSGKFANDIFANADTVYPADIEAIAQEIVDNFFNVVAPDEDSSRVIIDVLDAELALHERAQFDLDIFGGIARIRMAVIRHLDTNPKFEYFREFADWDVVSDNILQSYGARLSLGVLRSGSVLKKSYLWMVK